MKYLILTLILTVTGCTHDPVETIKKYNGNTEQEMISILGKPDFTETIPLSECRDEMRFPIQEYFPVGQRNQPDIFVKELWWKDGNYNLTSWFKSTNDTWVVLESLRWQKDVLF